MSEQPTTIESGKTRFTIPGWVIQNLITLIVAGGGGVGIGTWLQKPAPQATPPAPTVTIPSELVELIKSTRAENADFAKRMTASEVDRAAIHAEFTSFKDYIRTSVEDVKTAVGTTNELIIKHIQGQNSRGQTP